MPNSNGPNSINNATNIVWYSSPPSLEFPTGSVAYFAEEHDPIDDLIEDANDGIEALKRLSKEYKGKFKVVNGIIKKKENI